MSRIGALRAGVLASGAATVRRGLALGADRVPALRRSMGVAHRELGRALGLSDAADPYGADYFGEGRDPLDRMGLSGYATYDRASSNADVAAYLVWRGLAPDRCLDVGCALGFVVEALRELGVEAFGVDVSPWAVDHAAPGARPHVRRGDLITGLPFRARTVDVVTAFEVLEHLPPAAVPRALRELARVTRGHVLATIPSFGPNPYGPDGWFEVKVRPDRLDHYRALGPEYDGPVPTADLNVDGRGRPLEGHLTIASFRWWTERFAEAGLERRPALERRLHPVVARFGMTKYWALYALARPGVPDPPDEPWPSGRVAEVEARWGLTGRRPPADDLATVAAVLGLAEADVVRRGLPG